MQKIWNTVAHLVIGLWLGGLIALFIFVVTLFHNDHALAAQAAPQLFQAFEIYQFFLAAVAIVSTIVCLRPLVTMLLIAAAVCAVYVHVSLTPRILELARLGQTHSDEFGRTHGESMLVYMTDTILVFAAQILLTLKRK
jgi:hypothetical protein